MEKIGDYVEENTMEILLVGPSCLHSCLKDVSLSHGFEAHCCGIETFVVFGKHILCGYMKNNPVWEHEEQTTSINKSSTLLWCHPLALFFLLFIKTGVIDAKHLTQLVNMKGDE